MIRGSLFTRFFLEDGIRETSAYRAFDPARIKAFANFVQTHWTDLSEMHRPSEAETKSEFLWPIVTTLGWHHMPEQEPGRGRRDIADDLLFVDEPAKAKARTQRDSADRFRFGAVVVEYEARDTPLDRASGNAETPSTQIFAWNEEDRLRRRARLDALFFHLYGLDRDAADYVLGTFPIVQREEQARYDGRFRSRDLILGYMAALAAGQPDAAVLG